MLLLQRGRIFYSAAEFLGHSGRKIVKRVGNTKEWFVPAGVPWEENKGDVANTIARPCVSVFQAKGRVLTTRIILIRNEKNKPGSKISRFNFRTK
jgi:hypothetical protein